MDFLRVLINLIFRVIGVFLLGYSIYYGIIHPPHAILAGVIHIPSLLVVGLGLLGIAFSSYQLEIIFNIIWNTILQSPTILHNRLMRNEAMLSGLTEIYYDKGASALLREVEARKMGKLWLFIASKLEAQVSLADIQMLVQAQAKEANEKMFRQIRAMQGLASIAPAVGMTGTILGLIKLLKDLHDFDSLGSNMALAFITALYGLIFGNFIFIPIVNRLNAAREESMQLVSQALFWLNIVANRNPAHYLDKDEKLKLS